MSTSSLTRRATLLGGAALVGGGAMLAAAGGASAAPSAQDIRILNFVLQLEEIELGFYAAAIDQGALRGELAEFATTVAAHEREHVGFLRDTLGAKARPKPKLQIGTAVTSGKRFVAAATTLEDTVVSAYNGQAANLGAAALGAAARIVSVEARHAAWIRAIAGQLPAEDPTDPIATEAQVRAAIAKLGFLR